MNSSVTFAVQWMLQEGYDPQDGKLRNALHGDAANIGYNLMDTDYYEGMVSMLLWSCDRPVTSS